MSSLLEHLRDRSRGGRRLLVPYVVAGLPEPEAYSQVLAALAEHADALEVGLPYSDPLMDGPVIASAAQRALRAGVGPLHALDLTAGAVSGPRIAMTYYNPVHRAGEDAFCERCARAGFAGLIVPDLPLEASAPLRAAAARRDLAWIPLVAPTTPHARVAALARSATGFVYAVSTLGVTGRRESLSERAGAVVAACREVTDLPVLVGIGVSTPEQAYEAATFADGVVVGTAVVEKVLEEGAAAARDLLARMREALDRL